MQPPILQLDIEFEIRELLEDAGSVLAAGDATSHDVSELIVELLDCATRAKVSGFPFSERQLSAAAEGEFMPKQEKTS